jgi:hypothetical protein
MEKAALDFLYARKYTPVFFQGRPTTVEYTFTITVQPNPGR